MSVTRALFAFACLLLAAVPSTATVVIPALDFAAPGSFVNNGGAVGGYASGWRFKANEDILVNRLSFYDYRGDGLSNSHEVGIFTDAGTLVVSDTVLPSDPLVGSAPWREHTINPTLLTAGNYYWIIGVTGIVDEFTASPGGFAVNPAITFWGSGYGYSNSLTMPTATAAGAEQYFGPSFSMAPEPATVLLCGLGLLAIGRRKPAK